MVSHSLPEVDRVAGDHKWPEPNPIDMTFELLHEPGHPERNKEKQRNPEAGKEKQFVIGRKFVDLHVHGVRIPIPHHNQRRQCHGYTGNEAIIGIAKILARPRHIIAQQGKGKTSEPWRLHTAHAKRGGAVGAAGRR